MWKSTYNSKGNQIHKENLLIGDDFKNEEIRNYQDSNSFLFDVNSKEQASIFSREKDCLIVPKVLSKENLFLIEIYSGNNNTFLLIGDEENKNGDFYIKQYHPLKNTVLQTWRLHDPVEYIFSDENRIIVYPNGEEKRFAIKFLDGSQKDIFFESHTEEIHVISVSKKEDLAVSSGEDNMIKIWNLKTGYCLKTISINSYPEYLNFFKNEVIIGWKGDPRLWIWNIHEEKFLFKKSDNSPSFVKINEIENSLFFGENNGNVEKRNIVDGTLIWRANLAKDVGTPFCISFFSEISIVAIGGSLGNICLLDIDSGQKKSLLLGHQDYVFHLMKIGDNKLISSGLDEYIRFWDIQKRKCMFLLDGHIHRISEMKITSDHQHLLSYDRAGRLLLWSHSKHNSEKR